RQTNWRLWNRQFLWLSWHVCGGKRRALQHCLDNFFPVIQMRVQRRRENVHPLRRLGEKFKRLSERNLINPQMNDVNALVNSALYFAFDLWRSIRIPGKDQDHNTTGLDRIDNRFAPISARNNITRRYPADHRVCFEPCHNRLSNGFVLYRVTYED